MADNDWKKRVGIEINVSSGEEDTYSHIERKRQDSSTEECKHDFYNNDDILSDFDQYSKTPPRTRILRRSREKKQRDLISGGAKMIPKTSTSKFNRRNTISNVFFNELMSNANSEESDQDVTASGKRADKRSLKLLRGSERDLKLDISRARVGPSSNFDGGSDERAESLPVKTPVTIQIETANRFMSLVSRPVSTFLDKKSSSCCPEPENCPKNRVDFYKTFSLLIRMGCKENKPQDRNCRRHISQEEQVWQNELKDLVWLQLQAWHADRTVTEQDRYLCTARETVGELLDEIMNYRFQRKPMKNSESQISVQSNDSGVHDTDCSNKTSNCEEECPGCLSMYCQYCTESQNEALREVEQLLSRLDAAEALYPSNKSFGQYYPLYKSDQFVGRVKAMCLWYNMTKHLRLKLLIIGKLLMFLQNKHCNWPNIGSASTTASSGIQADQVNGDGRSYSRSTSAESTKEYKNNHHIQFDIDESSPSDSNSSNSSIQTQNKNLEPRYMSQLFLMEFYNLTPIAGLEQQNMFENKTSPYRKYIEDVLKTKGLTKSLTFLERLHRSVLRKAHISLTKPTAEKSESDILDDDLELVKYGAWSPEAQALGLPSYRSAFLFLSLVPVEVIHEFLRMRLEQKPDKPSPLSIRQLMREMKEGICIAVLHRKRVHSHFETVLSDEEVMLDNYKTTFTSYDNSLYEVLKVYLDYLEQWALLHHETFQKSLIEEEWSFIQEQSPQIPGGQKLASEKFCVIVSAMLNEIGERLISQIDELLSGLQPSMSMEDDRDAKENIFLIFREIQSIFNEERERTLKTISFTKTLRKDIVSCDKADIKDTDKCVRQETIDNLKKAVLNLKSSITKSIEEVQNACNLQNIDELDETERITLLSRCREILHQAFRYGFEYHKEISVFFPENKRESLARSMVQFARLWMKFVKDRCERGRGLRPRWAYQGLDFLMTVCEPCHTIYLTDGEFEDLKNCMDSCISHVIGTATPTTPEFCSASPRSALDYPRYPRSRGSSPSPRTSIRSPLPRPHRKVSMEHLPQNDSFDVAAPAPSPAPVPDKKKDVSFGDTVDAAAATATATASSTSSLRRLALAPRHQRTRDSINRLELQLEERYRSNNLIGCVTEHRSEDKIHIRYKRVTFGWQRGIKIGQGRFGKVYTAVNNETGEMMAMKEIALQHNDHRTIRHLAEELRILEGINQTNLVKYYGIEIHREEMLIFMEFCTEGTLESLIAATESGLPELLVRKFTHQMLSGVAELHRHGIVHRDIKSANIFLTDDGNCLKIGDFGSAVKIKAHTTMPGELQGFVGTQAYMAPEVFMKTSSEGHGRAADIWSCGCVVIEMASGKRPWAEFDSNYQIMFKVGMGETPEIPSSLSDEGQEFVELCLQHNPNERATAEELLNHNFAKVGDGY